MTVFDQPWKQTTHMVTRIKSLVKQQLACNRIDVTITEKQIALRIAVAAMTCNIFTEKECEDYKTLEDKTLTSTNNYWVGLNRLHKTVTKATGIMVQTLAS